MGRLKEALAMMLVGDALLALIAPVRHTAVWRTTSPRWNRMLAAFAQHPGWTRVVAGAELAGGLALAARQWRRV